MGICRGLVLILLHEHVSPLGWRGMIVFAIGLILFVKLMDYLAGRTVSRVSRKPRKSRR